MESSWPERGPSDRKRVRVIEELTIGREFAHKLQAIVMERSKAASANDIGNGCGGAPMAAEDLAIKILGSFNQSLSILNSGWYDEVSQVPAASWDGRKSEDSSDSCKTSALKEKRGCYKRRKTSDTWTRETPNLIDDGHAWRKYGQKVILNANHPRNYYRCTHKFDQGCQATKQVQKFQDEPQMYRITYHGHHTCKSLHKSSEIILDSPVPKESSIFLSFQSNGSQENNRTDFALSGFHSVKQETKELEGQSCCIYQANNQLSHDLTSLEASADPMAATYSSGSDIDHEDVISSGMYSCTASTPSFDLGTMVDGVNFDDLIFEL